jgi:hypothetical protein
VIGRREIGLDRGFGRRGRIRARERGNFEDGVDRRRLRLGFREAVALRQRAHLVCVDAVDQAIEMFPHARVGARAVGRLQQDVDGAIEFHLGAVEVTHLQFTLASLEMGLRFRDECRHRIRWRLGNRRRRGARQGRRLRRRDVGSFLRLWVRPARGERERCRYHEGDRCRPPGTHEHSGAPARIWTRA